MNEEKTNNKESVTRIDSDLYAILKEEQIKHSDRYPRVSDIVNEAVSDWLRKESGNTDTENKKADAAEPKGFQYWESTDEYFQAYDNFRRLCFDLEYRAEFMIRYEKKFGHAARIHSEKVMDEYALNHPEYREAYDGKRNTQDKEHNVPSDRG